ncbi:Tripartite DNA replication factor [Rhizophlyctis rosea]|nr:Tripartite DNA replication factor [Rhizophlyctis rosea]
MSSHHQLAHPALTTSDTVIAIFQHLPIPTLLSCEQVCRDWSELIRKHTLELWRPRVLDRFPRGCAPAPYGVENWKDLAVNVYAWETGWQALGGKVRMERVKAGSGPLTQYFQSSGKFYKRELVGIIDTTYPDGNSGVLGAFPDGKVIATGFDPSGIKRGRLTTVFDEPTGTQPFEPILLPNLASSSTYSRPTTAYLCQNIATSACPATYTLSPLPKPTPITTNSETTNLPAPTQPVAGNPLSDPCTVGSTAVVWDGQRKLHSVITISPSTPTFLLHIDNSLEDAMRVAHSAHNEHFIVHLYNLNRRAEANESSWVLHLRQLSRPGALLHEVKGGFSPLPDRPYLTRGHIILRCYHQEPGQRNLYLRKPSYRIRRLKDLTEVGRLPMSKDILWVRTLNDGTIVGGRWHNPPMVFDAFRKVWMMLPGFPDDAGRLKGYYVVVKEYEVDEQGRRIGTPGVVKFHFGLPTFTFMKKATSSNKLARRSNSKSNVVNNSIERFLEPKGPACADQKGQDDRKVTSRPSENVVVNKVQPQEVATEAPVPAPKPAADFAQPKAPASRRKNDVTSAKEVPKARARRASIAKPSIGDSPDAKLPPLSQPSPMNRHVEDTVFWAASPPMARIKASQVGSEGGSHSKADISGIVSALRKHESEESIVTNKSSFQEDWTLSAGVLSGLQHTTTRQIGDTTPGGSGLKRSFSLSTLEQSPSARTSIRKRLRVAPSHWALADLEELSKEVESRASSGIDPCESVFVGPTTSNASSGVSPGASGSLQKSADPSPKDSARKFARGQSMPTLSSSSSPAAAEAHIHISPGTLGRSRPGTPHRERFQLQDNVEAQTKALKPVTAHQHTSPTRRSAKRSLSNSNSPTKVLPSTTESKMVSLKRHSSDEYEDSFEDDDLACSMALDAVQAMESTESTPAEVLNNNRPVPALRSESTISQFEPISIERKKFARFLVLEMGTQYQNAEYRMNPEKVLRLFDEAQTSEKYLHLREDWWDTDVNVGDYVHVIGEFDNESRCIVDNERNLLILHPDVLVSTTHVADSFECLRRSILQDRVKVANEMTAPIVYGNMLHELFQMGLKNRDFTRDTMEGAIQGLVLKNLESLWSIGETEVAAGAHLSEMVPVFQEWGRKFAVGAPQSDGVVQVHRGSHAGPKTTACVEKVLDIEEHIWSPMYGIKGNIDASVQVRSGQGHGKAKRVVAPLEVKTGKNTTANSHRAQTALYTLLMGDRYDVDVASGLLYYVRTGEMIQIPGLRDEIRGLLTNRNRMACYLNNRTKIPEMEKNVQKCQRCYALDTCTVYHKGLESGTADTSGLGSLFDKKTAHMTPEHVAFFDKWDRLVTLEEGDMQRFRKEMWTMTGAERQKIGRRMKVLPTDPPSEAAKGINRFRYRFVPADISASQLDSTSASLLSSHMAVGDPIVVSSEEGHLALAIGFIVDIQPGSVTVTVDREVRGIPKRLDPFDEGVNQNFWALETGGGVEASSRTFVPDVTLYRIDKDELTTGMALVRGNLVSLFTAEGDEKRRRLVVDLEAPVFGREGGLSGMENQGALNHDQKKAVEKVLAAKDYALILGMPGTGKTTTISYIIQSLVRNGKSVLLTSYTHSAVDNVLLKLKQDGVDFVRLGSPQKVRPAIVEYTPNHKGEITTVQGFVEFYASKQIVATTCLGINHMLFTKRKFDYCIVDEASQLTLPVCLGPLRFADIFVLVGDHYQLPPLVKNAEAKDNGLALSLFKRLSEAHPQAVVTLEHQYRMNSDIMQLSNGLIYNHRLRCGTEAVARSRLSVPKFQEGLRWLHEGGRSQSVVGDTCRAGGCWVREVIDPRRSVVFVDTDGIPALESRPGDLVQNDIEAELVHQVVSTLITCDVVESSIGIISPYRSQLKLISNKLKPYAGLEINTVDRYQGRDKDCVIVSLVRSNRNQNMGDLLRDWRRINVAFTRARTKLVIFGSRTTLEGTTLFKEFLKIVDGNSWNLSLPPQAHLKHVIPIRDAPSGRSPRRGKRSPTNGGGLGGLDEGKEKERQVGALKALVKGKAVARNVLDEIFLD